MRDRARGRPFRPHRDRAILGGVSLHIVIQLALGTLVLVTGTFELATARRPPRPTVGTGLWARYLRWRQQNERRLGGNLPLTTHRLYFGLTQVLFGVAIFAMAGGSLTEGATSVGLTVGGAVALLAGIVVCCVGALRTVMRPGVPAAGDAAPRSDGSADLPRAS